MRMFFVLALVLISRLVGAQEVPDLQLRFPTHIQARTDEVSNNGLALWAIFPDITAAHNGRTMLFVGGVLLQDEKRNWLEIMGGGRVNQDGYVDPMINIRFVKVLGRVTYFVETQNTFRKKRRRFLSWISASTPIGLGGIKLGLEMENINFLARKDSWGLGPEISYPLPLPLPSRMKISVLATYQFRNDRDFLRIYTVNTIRF